jgi:hypothetical protein
LAELYDNLRCDISRLENNNFAKLYKEPNANSKWNLWNDLESTLAESYDDLRCDISRLENNKFAKFVQGTQCKCKVAGLQESDFVFFNNCIFRRGCIQTTS